MFAQELLVLLTQQGQVIDAGGRRGRRNRIGRDPRLDGGLDVEGVSLFQVVATVPDFDVGQVEGVVAQLYLLADQVAGDGVAVALEVDVASCRTCQPCRKAV